MRWTVACRTGLVRVRARRVGVLAMTAGLLGLWVVTLEGSAAASLPSGCSSSGVTVTCTFSYTGAAQTFMVPTGITSIRVDARGAAGGSVHAAAGGKGARVQGTLGVTSGETLQVNVGGQGGNGLCPAGDNGGWNGGGYGGPGQSCGGGLAISGGGGGASDLRVGADALADRLLVAAGGGGAGGAESDSFGGLGGGAGGGSSSDGIGGTSITGATGGGPGLAGGTSVITNGGSGGLNNGKDGGSGGLGTGGNGGGTSLLGGDGGGGGGGYYGGGAGGSGGVTAEASNGAGGGGGGGGSNYTGPATSTTGTDGYQAGDGQVTISYAVPIAQASPSPVSFPGTQPQSTVSAPQTVTVTNTGGGQLFLYGLTFAGADPQDFLITSNGCMGEIAANMSCTVGVSFAPHGAGCSQRDTTDHQQRPRQPGQRVAVGHGRAATARPTRATRPAGPGGKG